MRRIFEIPTRFREYFGTFDTKYAEKDLQMAPDEEFEETSHYIQYILNTWTNGRKPKFHVSEQGSGKIGHHSDYIDIIPQYLSDIPKNYKYFHEKAFHLADKLGINKNILNQNKSKELSVGQKQRIAIIRAIINTPKIILADEPTSALDNKNKIKFIEILFEVCEQEKTTLLMVSHDTSLIKHFDDNYLLESLNKVL